MNLQGLQPDAMVRSQSLRSIRREQLQYQKEIIASLQQFIEKLRRNSTPFANANATPMISSGGNRVIIWYSDGSPKLKTNKWNIRICNQLPWLKCPTIPSNGTAIRHCSKKCCTIMACSRHCHARETCQAYAANSEPKAHVANAPTQIPSISQTPKEQYKWGGAIYIPIGHECASAQKQSKQRLHWYKECINSINPIEIANDVMAVMDNADDQKQLVIDKINREMDILARRMPTMFTYSSLHDGEPLFQPVLVFNINNAEVSISKLNFEDAKKDWRFIDNPCIYVPFGFHSDKMTELQIQQHALNWLENNAKEKLIAPIIEKLEKY